MDPFTSPRIFQSSAKTVSNHYLCYRSPGDSLCSISPGVSLSWLSPGGTGMGGTLPGAGHQPSTECPLPFLLLLLLLSRLKGPWNKEQSAEEFSHSFPWSCWNILPMGIMSFGSFLGAALGELGKNQTPQSFLPQRRGWSRGCPEGLWAWGLSPPGHRTQAGISPSLWRRVEMLRGRKGQEKTQRQQSEHPAAREEGFSPGFIAQPWLCSSPSNPPLLPSLLYQQMLLGSPGLPSTSLAPLPQS